MPASHLRAVTDTLRGVPDFVWRCCVDICPYPHESFWQVAAVLAQRTVSSTPRSTRARERTTHEAHPAVSTAANLLHPTATADWFRRRRQPPKPPKGGCVGILAIEYPRQQPVLEFRHADDGALQTIIAACYRYDMGNERRKRHASRR